MSEPTPDVEELLTALDGSDDADVSDDVVSDGKKSNPVKDLRKFAEQVLKEKKAADKKALALEEQLSKYRQVEEARIFESLGLDEKKASLFKTMRPDADVTAENVAAFLEEFGLATEPKHDEEGAVSDLAELIKPKAPDFKPTIAAGEPAGGATYSSDDIINLILSGRHAEAQEIVARAARNPSVIKFKHADKMPA